MLRNYQSTGSRDPIWTQVACDPEDGLRISQDPLHNTGSNETHDEGVSFRTKNTFNKGLNITSAAVFIVGEMAGSGVLALPKAIVNSGWIGLVLLVIFSINAAYGGTKLGACWDILEERYPEHRGRTRNPYATIAYRAVGKWGSVLVSGCIQFTLFGVGTVNLILASQLFQELLSDFMPNMSFCFWFVVIAFILIPPMWLGSPKDFSLVGIGAILTTAVACVLFFTQIVMDGLHNTQSVKHNVHGFRDFSLAFGTLLFAFGGASTFPTIQNDMEKKDQFSVSVVIAFSVIMVLYLPVTAGGYFVYGEDVDNNLSLSLSRSSVVTCANILMAVHLILAFLIVINPVCQELEEILNVPHYYHWKRCLLRTVVVVIMVCVGESIPQFGYILSLVGGSTITLLTFVFPQYFYMKLCNQENPLWPQRYIPLHEKVYMWELIFIGLLGGTASTYSAIISIFEPDTFRKPCYWS